MSEVPFGNLSYWFQGSSIVLSVQLNQGMFFQPIGVYVNKTAPPRGPPSQQDSQAMRLPLYTLPHLCRGAPPQPGTAGVEASGHVMVSLWLIRQCGCWCQIIFPQQGCCARLQAVVKFDGSDPNWDMLAAPFTSCVSYVKDLSPLNFGDQVRLQRTASSLPCRTSASAEYRILTGLNASAWHALWRVRSAQIWHWPALCCEQQRASWLHCTMHVWSNANR